MSAYRQTWLERNHGSKAHFAQPGRIKLIDTIKIEAQAKPQTAHFKPSRDFLLCPHRGGSGNLHSSDKWNFCLSSA